MKIIDAQVHIWGTGTPNHDHRQVSSFTAEELLAEMAEAGVDAAVLHPPSWDPDANAMSEAAAARYPDRFAILGQVPLDRPATSRPLLEAGWRQRPGQCGLRYALVRPEQQSWPFDGTMDWLWPVAERQGLPIAMLARRFLPEFVAIAERHPGLRLIIDHCGLIRQERGPAAFADLDSLLKVAKLPNVALKATGAPHYSLDEYPFRDIHDGLHRIYDAFGPDRFFWGTDITRMRCSWRQCITLFTEELPWLKGKELETVMGRGICEWIGWQPKG